MNSLKQAINTAAKVSSSKSDSDEVNKEATESFKIFLYLFVIVLVIMMLGFIYNLVKCYLPKWLGKKKNPKKDDENQQSYDLQNSKIEEEA